MSLGRFVLGLIIAIVLSPPASANDETTASDGINEQLGAYLPADLVFVDQEGDSVAIGELVNKPTILSLVYHTCPSVCRPLLTELAEVLRKVDATPGEDYDIITLSFDENDSPDGSRKLKQEYLSLLDNDFPADSWTFLTGDSASIREFTGAVGFGYRRVDKDFAHPTTLIVVSGEGKICRYLMGSAPAAFRKSDSPVSRFLPADVKLALVEASAGRVAPTIAKFFKFCFSYDPEGRRFALNATRVAGASTLIGVAGLVVFISAAGRRRKREVNKNV